MHLPKLKLPNLTVCRINYSSRYNPSVSALEFLADKQHSLHLPTLANYNARPTVGLWWLVTSNTMLGKKAVVRHWCSRRMREAFVEALKQRGFDKTGTRLMGHNLTGTLHMLTLPVILKANFDVLKKEAGMVIEYLAESSRRQTMPMGGTEENVMRRQRPEKFEDRRDKPLIKGNANAPPISPRKASKYGMN